MDNKGCILIENTTNDKMGNIVIKDTTNDKLTPSEKERILGALNYKDENGEERSQVVIKKSPKYYIRFGDLPKDNHSRQYQGDAIVKIENGISVYDCAIANDVYYPILPKDFTESTLQGYIKFLWCNRPVYLVTGIELDERGADNEPLLRDVKIVEDLTETYKYFKKMFSEVML